MNPTSPTANKEQISEPASRRHWRTVLGSPLVIALFLFGATLGVFWPAVSHPFMSIDDGEYVTEHPFVPQGLTWEGIGVALTARHSGNWHPLTTLSHMVDCQFFGLNPRGHHLVNIIIHGLNGALVFLVLNLMTGSRWRSFFVAAFFALHPLRVESVAWISERKDVLSVFFCLLTIWAYARYVGCPKPAADRRLSARYYWITLVFFALALLSKPMAVTLPCVLLLLDYWPLQRFQFSELRLRVANVVRLWPLLREKIPFIILSAVLSFITSQVQQGAMAELTALPLPLRTANMFLSYCAYLQQTFWPVNLAVVYPYDPKPTMVAIGSAVTIILAVSALAWLWRNRRPWLLGGWLWFLGTLVPAIGIVQVGIQAHADRYTYLPSIGLLVLVVWTVAHLAGVRTLTPEPPPTSGTAQTSKAAVPFGSGSLMQMILVCVAVAAVVVITGLTRAQLVHWENSEKLMLHTERVAGPSELMRGALGGYYYSQGKLEEAAKQYRLGMQTAGDGWAYVVGLANVYAAQGKTVEAERYYRRALASQASPSHHFVLADFLQHQNRFDEARTHYLQGLSMAPYHAKARNQLGNVYAKQQNWPAAREQYERALRLNPKSAGLHFNLANVLAFQGEHANAVAHYNQALQLNAKTLQQNPANAPAHFGLAGVYAALNQPAEVTRHLREAIRLDPTNPEPFNNLAWLLATQSAAELRNGPEAVSFAVTAVKLTKTNDVEVLDTLAAAYAEAGQFAAAVETAKKAIALAKSTAGQPTEQIEMRLRLYEQSQPFREPARSRN